jgi:hypothetical protein
MNDVTWLDRNRQVILQLSVAAKAEIVLNIGAAGGNVRRYNPVEWSCRVYGELRRKSGHPGAARARAGAVALST